MSDLPPPDPSQRNLYTPEPPIGGDSASDDRLRRILVVVGGIAMVVFAIGLGLVVLRDDGPDDSSGAPASSASGATEDSMAPATTTAVASTQPPSTQPPTTVPGSTAPTTATTVATATTGSTVPATSTTVAPDPATRAVATAQALLNAFAEGRWNDARSLNPGRNETDAFLQQAYGPIESATVIPAAVTPVNGGEYDVRFGIVAHENQPTGPQTVLMCSHWQVNVNARTIERLDSARIRVESGYIDPQARSGELSSVCAKLPLR